MRVRVRSRSVAISFVASVAFDRSIVVGAPSSGTGFARGERARAGGTDFARGVVGRSVGAIRRWGRADAKEVSEKHGRHRWRLAVAQSER